jgi:DNA-binding GntR family transcriptional regulator
LTELRSLREGLDDQMSSNLPLAEQAHDYLQHEIITLRMKPGEVVNEAEIRRKLGIGRTPIREALLRLSGERLITIHPRRGTFVSDMNITDLGAVYEIRADLEALAARLAAERGTESERIRLAELRQEIPELVSDADFERLLAVDRRLHQVVYQLTKNVFLMETLEHYLSLSIRLAGGAKERRADSSSVEWLRRSVQGFAAVLEDIEEGRTEEAAAAARAHVVAAEGCVRQHV